MEKVMTPDQQRADSVLSKRAARRWAEAVGYGTKRPTFPEISRAPERSSKNLRCAGRKPGASLTA